MILDRVIEVLETRGGCPHVHEESSTLPGGERIRQGRNTGGTVHIEYSDADRGAGPEASAEDPAEGAFSILKALAATLAE